MTDCPFGREPKKQTSPRCTLKRKDRRSLFRKPLCPAKNRFSAWKRPARTSPSTFLFLPLHLSNSLGPKSRSHTNMGDLPDLTRRQYTTGFYRLCTTHHKVRSNTGANACPGQFRSSAALSGGAYMALRSGCQRPMSTNRRIESFFCSAQDRAFRAVVFWRRRAALEPQSCDDLLIDNHRESPATSGDHRLFIS